MHTEQQQYDYGIQEFVERLKSCLPPVFPRSSIGKLTGFLFSGAYIRNLCSKGKGPHVTKICGKTMISRDDFISWLIQHDAKTKKSRNQKQG